MIAKLTSTAGTHALPSHADEQTQTIDLLGRARTAPGSKKSRSCRSRRARLTQLPRRRWVAADTAVNWSPGPSYPGSHLRYSCMLVWATVRARRDQHESASLAVENLAIAATPPDSAGNGRAPPAETSLRTALSSGCSQSRCADQAAPRPVETMPRLPDLARSFEPAPRRRSRSRGRVPVERCRASCWRRRAAQPQVT